MKIKLNSHLISGFLFSIFSIIMLLQVPIQIRTRETTSINARTIPIIMLSLILALSIILIIQGLSKERKEYIIDKTLFKNKAVKRELKSIIFILMLLIYALIFNKVGFLISSILLSTGILIYYKCKIWWFYAISYLNIGIVFFVFKLLLRVSLP